MRTPTLLVSIVAAIALSAPGPDPGDRIVGGDPAGDPPGAIAAIVDHFAPDASEGQLCGGVVVADRHVLTSARCVAGRLPAQLDVITGRLSLAADDGERTRVTAIAVHPGFDGARVYDAALLTLAGDVSASPAVFGAATPGEAATVFGWGDTRSGGGAGTLRSVAVPILDDPTCIESYGSGFVTGAMVCAGGIESGGFDFCDGDEGGPLVAADGTVIGLASWHVGCAVEGFPGVYTAAGPLAAWAAGAAKTGDATCNGKRATLVGTDGVDVLVGTPDDDVIVGLGGRDLIEGRGGDDLICAGDGRDVVDGGIGNDIVFGEAGHDRLAGGSGDDTLDGGEDADRINGGPGHDTIIGAGGGDLLAGDGGDDEIDGGDGDDRIEGGTGHDLLTGGPGDDDIVGGPDVDILSGGDGSDTLDGNDGDDRIDGGNGDDHIVGMDGDDRLDGGDGDDTVLGVTGADIISGGDGNDTLRGQAGDDEVDGGAGADFLLGLDGDDLLVGGPDDDRLFGGPGDDRLDGGSGDDLLHGNEGNDVLEGADGDDDVIGDEGNDRGTGGAGTDRCFVELFGPTCEVVSPHDRVAAPDHPRRAGSPVVTTRDRARSVRW